MKFNENRSKGSGDMERARKYYGRNDGRTDRLTDRQTEGIPITPSASGRGINNALRKSVNPFPAMYISCHLIYHLMMYFSCLYCK